MMKKLQSLRNQLFGVFLIATASVNAQDLEWVKQFKGASSQEPKAITLDAQSNIYTVGYFEGTVDFDPGDAIVNLTTSGGRAGFISKMNSSGQFVWAKQVPADQVYSGNIDTSGNIYVAGEFSNSGDFDPGAGEHPLTSVGSLDIFVLKLNANGDFVWAKSMGGANVDRGYSVVANDDGVYVSGTIWWDPADLDPGPSEYIMTLTGRIEGYTLKLSADGNFVWAKQFVSTPNKVNMVEAVALDTAGNVYSLIRFEDTVDFNPGEDTYNLTSFGSTDAAIVKLNAAGEFIWAKQMGGSSSDEPAEMVIDADGYIYSTGYFGGAADFDPSPSSDYIYSTGSIDAYVTKWDADGNYVWAKKLGSTGPDDGKGINVDSEGNVYATGLYKGALDADPSSNEYLLESYGDNDVYVVKLDSNGNFVWGTRFGGFGLDLARAIVVNKTSSDVYVTGAFTGAADFDSGANEVILNANSATDKDMFVAKLSQSSLSTSDKLSGVDFQMYPIPVSNILHIKGIDSKPVHAISLYDMSGRLMKSWTFDKNETIYSLEMSQFKMGAYLLKIHSEASVFSKMIIKGD